MESFQKPPPQNQRVQNRRSPQQPSPKLQQRQQQQQLKQNRYPHQQPVTLHIRSQPSPPIKAKHKHNHDGKQQLQHSPHKQRQQQQQQPPQSPRKLHLHLHNQNNPPLVLSTKRLKPEMNKDTPVTSQPGISNDKNSKTQTTGKPKSYAQNQKDKKTSTEKSNTNNMKNSRIPENQRITTQPSPKLTRTSKNTVGASETGRPKRFGDEQDKNPNSPENYPEKLQDHDLTGIPQTNLSVGLIVFCCFNPVFGLLAVYLSLSAAKAYRDGLESKGATRAHWSILISLFGITVTMVIVSMLVVVFSVSKHSNSHYRRTNHQGLGF